MTAAESVASLREAARSLREAAAIEGRIAARWLEFTDGRKRRRAARAAKSAATNVRLAEMFEAQARQIEGN